MAQGLNESRFYMWRSVVAMVHADGVVTPHEVSFINDYVKDLDASQRQLEILGEDLRTPQPTCGMFSKVTNQQDKRDFFALARALSWCDGDYDAQEKFIIESLEQENLIAENQEILNETRAIVSEVELCRNQWKFKANSGKNLFSFFEARHAKAV